MNECEKLKKELTSTWQKQLKKLVRMLRNFSKKSTSFEIKNLYIKHMYIIYYVYVYMYMVSCTCTLRINLRAADNNTHTKLEQHYQILCEHTTGY